MVRELLPKFQCALSTETLPLVSVVIPCYNGEKTIARAIDSALDQDYPKFEVLVVDDGSTDNSLSIIKSYRDSVRWISEENRGGGAARNCGLRLSYGEYVQFLDADDLLHTNRLSLMVNASRGLPEMTIAVSDGMRVSTSGDCSLFDLVRIEADDPVLYCLSAQLPVLAPLHRRSDLVSIGGFAESLPCSQERDLHLRLSCSGFRFSHVRHSLFSVYRQQGSVSSDYARVLDQHLRVFSVSLDLLRQRNELTDTRQTAFAHALALDARHYFRLGLKEKGMTYFHAALGIDPYGAMSSFGHPVSQLLARTLGPVWSERVVGYVSRIISTISRPARKGLSAW